MSTKSLFSFLFKSFFFHLAFPCPFLCFLKTAYLMRHAAFVTAVYEDCYGMRRPIGLIHRMKIHGQEREIFTYCAANQKQPDIALFVRRRTGDLADQVSLSFEGQEEIPSYLKHLPDPYRAEHLNVSHAMG